MQEVSFKLKKKSSMTIKITLILNYILSLFTETRMENREDDDDDSDNDDVAPIIDYQDNEIPTAIICSLKKVQFLKPYNISLGRN